MRVPEESRVKRMIYVRSKLHNSSYECGCIGKVVITTSQKTTAPGADDGAEVALRVCRMTDYPKHNSLKMTFSRKIVPACSCSSHFPLPTLQEFWSGRLPRIRQQKRDIPMTSGQLLNLPTRAISSKLRNCPNYQRSAHGQTTQPTQRPPYQTSR